MSMSAYRITISLTAILCEGARERLQTLDVGSILIPTSSMDPAGMVEATCDGHRVRVFARDLDEKSERIEVEPINR